MSRYTTIMKESLEELEKEILELKKIGFKRNGEPKKMGKFYVQIMNN